MEKVGRSKKHGGMDLAFDCVPISFRCMRSGGKRLSWGAGGFQASGSDVEEARYEIFCPYQKLSTMRVRPIWIAILTSVRSANDEFAVVGPVFNPKKIGGVDSFKAYIAKAYHCYTFEDLCSSVLMDQEMFGFSQNSHNH